MFQQRRGEPELPVDPAVLLDLFPGRVAVLDREQRFVHVNREQLRALARDERDVLGRTLADVVGEAGAASMAEHVEGVLAGRPQSWSAPSVLPSGEGRPLLLHLVPLPAAPRPWSGAFACVAVEANSVIDDTQRALARDGAMQVHCERLRTAAHLSRRVATELHRAGRGLDALLTSTDPDRDYLSVIEVLSTAMAELRSRLVGLLRGSDDEATTVPRPRSFGILPVVPPDSDVRPVDVTTTTDDAVRSLLRAALEALPMPVSTWSPGLVCTWTNHAAADFFGLTRDGMIGQDALTVLGREIFTLVLPHLQAAFDAGPQQLLRTVPTTDGSPRWTRATYAGWTRDGHPDGLVAVLGDQTEEVEAQRARAVAALHLEGLEERRQIAEGLLDPVLQRLFALTVSLSARPPSRDRGRELAADLADIALDLRELISSQLTSPTHTVLPWPTRDRIDNAGDDVTCTFVECAAADLCDLSSVQRAG